MPQIKGEANLPGFVTLNVSLVQDPTAPPVVVVAPVVPVTGPAILKVWNKISV